MIKVIDIEKKLLSSVEFDDYIPLNIEFGKWDISLEPTVYWRTGDFKNTLLEVGIDSNKGFIRSITLTLANRLESLNEVYNLVGIPIKEGIPVIQKEGKLNSTFTDEKSNFDLYLSENKIKIIFSENMINSIIKSDKIMFGLDENNFICYVEIYISQYERDKFKKYFNFC